VINPTPPRSLFRRMRTRSLGVALALLVGPLLAQAQTYTVVHNFAPSTDGALPNGELIQDAAGNLNGTTFEGGTGGGGTVFKLDPSGAMTILYSFTSGTDGDGPLAGLFRDTGGILYGTTELGGAYGLGTVFKLDTNNVLTTLHSFQGGTDGARPSFRMVSVNGELYGTTLNGGDSNCTAKVGCGTIFKITKGGKKKILHRFNPQVDGSNPQALVRDSAGNLYGAAQSPEVIVNTCDGELAGCGTIFELDTAGVFTVLYKSPGLAYGAFPSGRLRRDTSGDIRGVMELNGTSDGPYGAVFDLKTNGKLTVLHNFWGGQSGLYPNAGVLDVDGVLYGTTTEGGDLNCHWGSGRDAGTTCGVLYQIGKTGQYTVLHRFAGAASGDGAWPGFPTTGELTLGADGSIYGVTPYGGTGVCNNGSNRPSGCGVIFKYTP
jgi:uncharacterized repeat protein (TIGR03803 family)